MARPKSKKLPLTAEILRGLLSYSPDSGQFIWRVYRGPRARINSPAGTPNQGYIYIKVDGVFYGAHRLAWLHYYGEWPNGQVDHINRDRTDNRIANLRSASQRENARNCTKRADNTSGVKGVDRPGKCKRWRARIQVNHQPLVIGYYDTFDEAVAAYAEAAKRYHGVFASTG